MATPSFSLQPATTALPFTAVPPIPSFPHDCRCLPVADQASVAHLLWLAWSLPPAPIAPAYSYAGPQAIHNQGDLGSDFHTVQGNSSLPRVHPPPSYNPSYEGREFTLLVCQI